MNYKSYTKKGLKELLEYDLYNTVMYSDLDKYNIILNLREYYNHYHDEYTSQTVAVKQAVDDIKEDIEAGSVSWLVSDGEEDIFHEKGSVY